MQIDPLTRYNIAQDLLSIGEPLQRAAAFNRMGGTLRAPDPAPICPEDQQWHASFDGVTRSADTSPEAIESLAKALVEMSPRRATDGRPDCPYNGAAPLPDTVAA